MSDGLNSDGFHDEEREGADDKLGIVELFYGVIFAPSEIFRRVAKNPPLSQGIIIFLVVSVMTTLAGTLASPQVPEFPPEFAAVLQSARPYLLMLGVFFAAMFWFIQAGVIHLIAELLGGTARSVTVLVVFALIKIPGLIMIPVHVANRFLEESFFSIFLSVAGGLAVFLWTVILLIIGLRETEGFSTGRAAAAVFIPIGVVVLLLIFLLISFVGTALPFL